MKTRKRYHFAAVTLDGKVDTSGIAAQYRETGEMMTYRGGWVFVDDYCNRVERRIARYKKHLPAVRSRKYAARVKEIITSGFEDW